MSPADEIRTAVTVLRCDHRHPVCPPEGSLAKPGDCRECGTPWQLREPVPDWLREPLAAWLESVADKAEKHAAQGWGNDQSEIACGPPLAAARAVTGRTP